MDAILLQILNGLDKGSAYALIALGLTLIFGTLGVVNFAHGALFMIGAFVAVTVQRLLSLSFITVDETQKDFLGNPLKVETPYVEGWFGPEVGGATAEHLGGGRELDVDLQPQQRVEPGHDVVVVDQLSCGGHSRRS